MTRMLKTAEPTMVPTPTSPLVMKTPEGQRVQFKFRLDRETLQPATVNSVQFYRQNGHLLTAETGKSTVTFILSGTSVCKGLFMILSTIQPLNKSLLWCF